MRLLVRGFIFFIFFFLGFFFCGKTYALQTPEIFATGIDAGTWDIKSNLYGAPDSVYATATNSYLSGYIRFSESLNIPVEATITSLVFKIYGGPSGNSGGSNYWNVYLGGTQCSHRPSLSLGNGLRTITIDAANCTGDNDFADVVQKHKLALNMSSSHTIGYPQINGTHTMVWDSVGVYATYELPTPFPTPPPSNIEFTPGSVWEWTTATVSATLKEGLTDIVSVSAGNNHSLALKSDGTVWAWGSNSNGQLGIGAVGGNSMIPVQVKSPDGLGYLADVRAVATGELYSMALKNDGTVWAWGANGYEARGTDNDSDKLLLPTQVLNSAGFSQIIAIGAGDTHSIALKSDGSVFA